MKFFAVIPAAPAAPHHAWSGVIFWLLVVLAVFIALLAVKVVIELVWQEIDRRDARREEHRRAKASKIKGHPDRREEKK